MNTYHIHITGIVQGVGFRPLVYKLALQQGLKGWVCNDNDGVHIEFNAINDQEAQAFYSLIIKQKPPNAVLHKYKMVPVTQVDFKKFEIKKVKSEVQPDLFLTPDIAICESCKSEIEDFGDKRFLYPFTTCLNCGPRYSIISSLPYDRENTTMASLQMCDNCKKEYDDVNHRRHYSQTNSCPDCSIPIHLYDQSGTEISNNPDRVIAKAISFLNAGKILAVKGIGGYLLICDATNTKSVVRLRILKQRPAKPFAVMYDSIEMLEKDVVLHDYEKEALLSKEAPIVLCEVKKDTHSKLNLSVIADGLNRLGVFLPYSPLLKLITSGFQKPLIATSGNLSGSPIIYADETALQWLPQFAEYIISFDRDIVAPQDDSVIQFAKSGRKIILRRSRGYAPNYIPNPFVSKENLLAMGAELKSAFALLEKSNLYISQFLGDQESYESQQSLKNTLLHLQNLLRFRPSKIVVDKHPGYHVSNMGKQIGAENNLLVTEVQHHVAHFAAVLQENNLIHEADKILGVIWDGTGYGNDGQIWGGEFFVYKNDFERVAHLDYFPQLAGDKMSKEPRLSALSLLSFNDMPKDFVRKAFDDSEWKYFSKLLTIENKLHTSSMGRLIDGISSILEMQQINTYEGESAMKLEALAERCEHDFEDVYPFFIEGENILWQPIVKSIIEDKQNGTDIGFIAIKFFTTLVVVIKTVAQKNSVNQIAFSGGVFQNKLLVELIEETLSKDFSLFFHRQLSPNDECISFGQLAFEMITNR